MVHRNQTEAQDFGSATWQLIVLRSMMLSMSMSRVRLYNDWVYTVTSTQLLVFVRSIKLVRDVIIRITRQELPLSSPGDQQIRESPRQPTYSELTANPPPGLNYARPSNREGDGIKPSWECSGASTMTSGVQGRARTSSSRGI